MTFFFCLFKGPQYSDKEPSQAFHRHPRHASPSPCCQYTQLSSGVLDTWVGSTREAGALGIHRNLWVLNGTSRDLQVQGQVPWFIGFCHARFFSWSQVVYILVCSWEGFEHANSPKRGDMRNKIGMQLHPPYVETPASVVAKFWPPGRARIT